MSENIEIQPCLCGKTPKLQFKKKPTSVLIQCCTHSIEVRPAFETDAYIESARLNAIRTWNHAMEKRKPKEE